MINLSNTLKKKNNKKGFTLIELIVVIAILGILAALAVPRLTGARDSAAKSVVEADARTIFSDLEIKYAQDGKYPASDYTFTGSFEGTPTYTPSADGQTYSVTYVNNENTYKITFTQTGLKGVVATKVGTSGS